MSKFKPGDTARIKNMPDLDVVKWGGRIVIIVAQVPPAVVAAQLPFAPPGTEIYQIEFIDGPPPELPDWANGYCAPHFILIPLGPSRDKAVEDETRELYSRDDKARGLTGRWTDPLVRP